MSQKKCNINDLQPVFNTQDNPLTQTHAANSYSCPIIFYHQYNTRLLRPVSTLLIVDPIVLLATRTTTS